MSRVETRPFDSLGAVSLASMHEPLGSRYRRIMERNDEAIR